MSPPARSVRPTEPAKSTSPTNRWPSAWKATDAGEWPGTSVTAKSIPASAHRLAAVEQVLGRVRSARKLAQQIGLAGRHPHVDAGLARDGGDPAQVVDVAVGHEHSGGRPAALLELAHRPCSGVSPGSMTAASARALPRHEIAVGLVGAERELDDLEAGRPVHAAGPPCFFW